MKHAFAALALAVFPVLANAAELPLHLDLQAPFPHVLLQAPSIESIAPGVEYGDYELWSDEGPISVHVIAADLRDPGVHVGTVLADDVLGPDPETVSSMAQRTGAIAGINGDYFDIGRTNHPTNIVVRDGVLIRTPRKRYALAILDSAAARFAEFSFSGSVQIGTQASALDGINVMPSEGTVTLLTPSFGPIDSASGVTLVGLQPTGAVPIGPYRITSFVQDDAPQPAGYYLAIAANSGFAFPNAGDTLVVNGTLAPVPLSEISAAVGGGPLILQDGHSFDDPDGPRGGAFDHRIPSSGAALEPDGTLLLIEVDGRQPERSVGLTRPQFAALMLALGAQDGMAFDGGGSSEMAVQLSGEPDSVLVSSPSDGIERRVADGLFIYNTSPIGAATRVAADPETIRAVPGATVPLHLETTDGNDHPVSVQAPVEATVEPSSLGTIANGAFVAAEPGTGTIRLRAGDVTGSIRVWVDATPARVAILPPSPNVDPGESVALQVRAFDASGYELALPSKLDWSASAGSIDDDGRFTAATGDADVRVAVGSLIATTRVTVGSHEQQIEAPQQVSFLTFPGGGPGEATVDPACAGCFRLQYAIGSQERVAYAMLERPLPDRTVGIRFELQDDGSGAVLRVALRNAIDEQILVTATTLDQPGRRTVIVRFPSGILQPVRLVGFYTIGTASVPEPKGAIVIGGVRALVAGKGGS
jgi:exopolysaccharide biosynthesis protein